MHPKSLLIVNSSGRNAPSLTRRVSAALQTLLEEKQKIGKITQRDTALGLPFVDEAWISANFTAAAERSDADRETLAFSDALVSEITTSDIVIVAAPIYNFGIPASLKAWVDLVVRAGLTFSYTADGPKGLIEGKKVIIIVSSGGVPVESDMDLATPYLKFALAFIGLKDATLIDCSKLNFEENLSEQLLAFI